jgi:AraC-like DNA-binding protein
MNFITQLPSPQLRHVVRNYWMFEVFGNETPIKQMLFPYGSFELIFYLRGEGLMRYYDSTEYVKQEKYFYSGQVTKSFELCINGPCKCLGVSFFPWAGKLMYDFPSDTMTDHLIPLDCLKYDESLIDLLSVEENTESFFRIIENYLKVRLHQKQIDKVVMKTIEAIFIRPDKNAATDFLNSNVGLSRRRIQQRFLESSGLSMKQFIRKVRFQKSLSKLKQFSPANSLTQIGLDSGYYDQAHFINEFNIFAGTTPHRFIRQKSELKNFFQSLVDDVNSSQ